MTKKLNLAQEIEWFWINFVQGFYDVRTNFRMWKTLIFKYEKLKPDLYYIIFWMYVSNEEIIIEALPYKGRKKNG